MNTKKKIILFLGLFLGVISSTLTAQDFSEQEKEMLRLINDFRAENGRSPVRLNAILNRTAQLHSQDMGENNYFDHIGLNGSEFDQRARNQGYEGFPKNENIAAGNVEVQRTFEQWKNSSGHRRNILENDVNEMGIGYANVPGSIYRHYWTQMFGIGETVVTPPPPVCSVIPYANIDNTGWKRTESIQMEFGSRVILGPQSSVFGYQAGGIWSWSGPNNFSSSEREIRLTNVRSKDSGTYTVTNTDQDNCTASLSFEVNVIEPDLVSISEDVVYELEPQSNTVVRLDVEYSRGPGALVHGYKRHGYPNQQWKFKAEGDNTYTLIPQHNTAIQLQVNETADSEDNATGITVQSARSSENQLWKVFVDNSGLYELEAVASPGKRLSMEDRDGRIKAWNSPANGSSNQKWRLVPIDATGQKLQPVLLAQLSLTAYPVPFDTSVTIDATGVQSESLLSVTDISGKLVYQNTVNNNSVRIATGSWNSGIYFLTMISEGEQITKKILKN